MKCFWANPCDHTNLCCNFCKVSSCTFRCEDQCTNCAYLEDLQGNLINTIKKTKVSAQKTSKHAVKVKTPVKAPEAVVTQRFLVRIGSGNGRGKNYYYDDFPEALAKAYVLQKRQKNGRKSLIIKATIVDGKEFYPLSNSIAY